MRLSKEQNKLAESNIGIVACVLYNNKQWAHLDQEELFQVGCVGLCKAAYTYNKTKAKFSTYAYHIVYNEICKWIEHLIQHQKPHESIDEIVPVARCYRHEEEFIENLDLLDRAISKTSGVLNNGLRSIIFLYNGYTLKEIGTLFGTNERNVGAWVSLARKYMRGRKII